MVHESKQNFVFRKNYVFLLGLAQKMGLKKFVKMILQNYVLLCLSLWKPFFHKAVIFSRSKSWKFARITISIRRSAIIVAAATPKCTSKVQRNEEFTRVYGLLLARAPAATFTRVSLRLVGVNELCTYTATTWRERDREWERESGQ